MKLDGAIDLADYGVFMEPGRDQEGNLVFTVNQAGAQVFGVLANSAMRAMKWPTKPPSRLIVPGEA